MKDKSEVKLYNVPEANLHTKRGWYIHSIYVRLGLGVLCRTLPGQSISGWRHDADVSQIIEDLDT
jgi:hypothetical protein